MGTPTTTMRLDEDVKLKARPILEELGLNVSSAVNVFLRAVVRCNGLPFDMTLGRSTANENNRSVDFAAEYLAPLMSGRNKQIKIGANPEKTRKRLEKRYEAINQDRRRIA